MYFPFHANRPFYMLHVGPLKKKSQLLKQQNQIIEQGTQIVKVFTYIHTSTLLAYIYFYLSNL